MDRLEELANKPVGRLLWQYSVPAVVGMLVMALYNVVDRIFIGQWVGPEAIAGLAVTFPIMNLATAIGVLVGVGASSRVSIVLGGGDKRQAELLLGNAMTLTLVNAGIYILVFSVFIDEMLRAFGASDATLPYGREYMLTLMPGLLLTNIAFGFNNIMRASGYPKRAMATMLLGAVVNVVLDPIFIRVLDMGIVGAAILRHQCHRQPLAQRVGRRPGNRCGRHHDYIHIATRYRRARHLPGHAADSGI